MIYRCSNCDSALEFDPVSGMMQCLRCGSFFDVSEYNHETETVKEVFCIIRNVLETVRVIMSISQSTLCMLSEKRRDSEKSEMNHLYRMGRFCPVEEDIFC